MKMTVAKFGMVTLAAATLLLAGGCQGGEEAPKNYRLAVVLKALDSEFWEAMKTGVEEAARQHPNVELSVQAPEHETNVEAQVKLIEDAIAKKVSGLVVAPADVAQVLPLLKKAFLAGIPVVLLDTDLPWADKVTYVGTDNKAGGKLAGDFLVKALAGKGQVAVIRGITGVQVHGDRIAGFQEGIDAASGIRFVTSVSADSDRAKAKTAMADLLKNYPALNAVFATNDQMALGAADALAEKKLTGKVKVVGYDAGQEALRAVKAGQLQAVVSQKPEEMGKQALEAALKTLQRQGVKKRIDTGATLITQENVAQSLK